MANESTPAISTELKISPTNKSSKMTQDNNSKVKDLIVMTSYAVEPGHTLIGIVRLKETDWRPEMKANASYIAEGEDSGIIINKKASMMDYNRNANGQKQRQEPPNAKMSFKVFLINSENGKLTLEHRTLRFWLLQHSEICINNNNNGKDTTNPSSLTANSLKQESSQMALAYFRQLIGNKPDDDFPKNYVDFLMKLMRLLKTNQFIRINKMEVELRQLAYEDHAGPPSRTSSLDGSQGCESASGFGGGNGGGHSGRGSPLTSQKVLDVIESSYPNPISMREICVTTQSDESVVRQFIDELAEKEKIQPSDDGKHFTRTTKPIDTKVNLVKQMPKVVKSQQPVIAILTAQYCEKLAVDSMISDKETFVRYRTAFGGNSNSNQDELASTSSSNYVYTLGNIGDHRVVSTKLTSVGNSRAALIAAGNATTRLLGTFPELEYVFLVGCAGGVANYTDFANHVRLGDVVVSDLDASGPMQSAEDESRTSSKLPSNEYVYVHCRPKQPDAQLAGSQDNKRSSASGGIPVSYSVHKNLKRAANGILVDYKSFDEEEGEKANNEHASTQVDATATGGNNSKSKPLEYEECHFRLWRPARLDLQELAKRIWLNGTENPKHRIWEYYIDEGIKTLKQQDIEAARPPSDTDKLFMSIGMKDTIEVSHPEAADDEIDLRKGGRPMCHFGPIGSGGWSGSESGLNEPLKQRMISEFGLRAFDSEFDPVVESIYGNCKESYIMIRGISDYKDGRKKNKEWQQYSALVAAAFMKSIIVNLKAAC